jgi:hypothetical protein
LKGKDLINTISEKKYGENIRDENIRENSEEEERNDIRKGQARGI